MMEWLKGWLLAVTCAAVTAAVAEALTPEGSGKKMVRLAGGLLLLLAVLGPVKRLDEVDLGDVTAKYQERYGGWREELTAASEDRMKAIIAEETSAYISDKAAALGLSDCRAEVKCRLTEDGFPVPDRVTVRGSGPEEAWSALCRAITADFAVGPENQTFERTDGP